MKSLTSEMAKAAAIMTRGGPLNLPHTLKGNYRGKAITDF
jgi:hypothetical protein